MRYFLLALGLLSVGFNNALAYEIRLGYEPFLVQQYNPIEVRTYSSGVQTASYYAGERRSLFFQLISVRAVEVLTRWKEVEFSFETGISGSPFAVRQEWLAPATASNFSGEITIPATFSTRDFWSGHLMGFLPGDSDRYLIEETNLIYVPATFKLDRTVRLGRMFDLVVGGDCGFQIFQINTIRKTRSGNSDLSITHVTKTLGLNLATIYRMKEGVDLRLDMSVNGVDNFSNFLSGSFTSESDGYRFDSLRYNAKLGVSWKI